MYQFLMFWYFWASVLKSILLQYINEIIHAHVVNYYITHFYDCKIIVLKLLGFVKKIPCIRSWTGDDQFDLTSNFPVYGLPYFILYIYYIMTVQFNVMYINTMYGFIILYKIWVLVSQAQTILKLYCKLLKLKVLIQLWLKHTIEVTMFWSCLPFRCLFGLLDYKIS